MKIHVWRLLCVTLLSVPLLSGCWDRLEIEERATVLGIAIDPLPAADKLQSITGTKTGGQGYRVSAQLAIPGRIPLGPATGGGGTTDRPVWVLSATGKTVDDAMNRLQENLADKIFLGQMRIVIINEQLAKTSGMRSLQDYLRRNAETRRLIWLMISNGEARQALQAAPKLERVPTLYLVGIMDHAVALGKIPDVFLGNYWAAMSSLGRDPQLPLISVVGDRIDLNGLAIFHDDRMVANLNALEVAVLMELTNHKLAGYGMAVPLPHDPSHSVILRGMLRHTVTKLKLVRNRPVFNVYVFIDLNIEEITATRGKLSDHLLQELSAESARILKHAQTRLIHKMKRLHVDSVGYGEYVRAQYPSYFAQFETRGGWNKEFQNVVIHLHDHCNVVRSGLTTH